MSISKKRKSISLNFFGATSLEGYLSIHYNDQQMKPMYFSYLTSAHKMLEIKHVADS